MVEVRSIILVSQVTTTVIHHERTLVMMAIDVPRALAIQFIICQQLRSL